MPLTHECVYTFTAVLRLQEYDGYVRLDLTPRRTASAQGQRSTATYTSSSLSQGNGPLEKIKERSLGPPLFRLRSAAPTRAAGHRRRGVYRRCADAGLPPRPARCCAAMSCGVARVAGMRTNAIVLCCGVLVCSAVLRSVQHVRCSR